MSKIYTKTQREPYLVLKGMAEKVMRDVNDEKILPNSIMEIKHLEGTKLLTKMDIRSVDVIYNDRDYYDKKSEIEPRKEYKDTEPEMTPEQIASSKSAMIKARENLVKMGIIRQK